jgi:hypothetical protein
MRTEQEPQLVLGSFRFNVATVVREAIGSHTF